MLALLRRRGYVIAMLIAAVVLPVLWQAPQAESAATKPRVISAELTGSVDPVMVRYVDAVLDQAERDNVDAVIFTLDTPGGLSTSMNDITKRFAAAKDTPVMVWVGPTGARAASAGTFITYAADVAAMAPATTIGSATPINANGGEIPKDLRKKIINDAVANITGLARLHDRDEAFAEAAVTKAENVSADDALKRNIIDLRATSIADLLTQVSGTTTVAKQIKIGDVADATIEQSEPSLALQILKVLIDPNILFLLFGAGLIGLAFELTHPGTLLPGIAGGICLVLALYGLQVLPATGAGLTLLGLGGALILAESLIAGYGVLGIGGGIALLIGSLMLFPAESGLSVSWPVLACAAIAIALSLYVLMRARRSILDTPVTSGESAVLQRIGSVQTAIPADGVGRVFVHGERWDATADMAIPAGATVRVESVTGLTVHVSLCQEPQSFTSPQSTTGKRPNS